MNDLIKKAVELANDTWPWDFHKKESVLEFSQYDLDALAAQLVRQVDALDSHHFITDESEAAAVVVQAGGNVSFAQDDDRTMNTIKAIVDSGVLDE